MYFQFIVVSLYDKVNTSHFILLFIIDQFLFVRLPFANCSLLRVFPLCLPVICIHWYN